MSRLPTREARDELVKQSLFSKNYLYVPMLKECRNREQFSGGSVVKNLPANAGDAEDMGSIHGSERSPGGENGNPL